MILFEKFTFFSNLIFLGYDQCKVGHLFLLLSNPSRKLSLSCVRLKTIIIKSVLQTDRVPASTTTIASQSQIPLPPLATAAAAREEVRLWDRDWVIPGSVDMGLEEGLGLEVGNKREQHVTKGWIESGGMRDGNQKMVQDKAKD